MEPHSRNSFGRFGLVPTSTESGAVRVAITELLLSDSPRLTGESDEHVRLLAESEVEFPPIIVQAGTNRVIDGAHRVRAAQLRGADSVMARYFAGDDREAFVLAVRSNVEHGLPLSLADRKTAAARILRDHPDLSNRAMASIVGLSPKTVGALRPADGGSPGQGRLGMDGRVRPLNAAAGRAKAEEILTRNPAASLQVVSREVGLSVRTVRDVRNRLGRPEVPDRDRARVGPLGREPGTVLRDLRGDPSLRFTEHGRLLLSLLSAATLDAQACTRLVAAVPEHCLGPVAHLASVSATAWEALAVQLTQRKSASA